MVLEPPDVLEEADLTDSDNQILDALEDGRLTKGAIVERTDLHRNTVRNRLDVLVAGDAVRPVHKGTKLYELVEDPRAEEGDRKHNATTEDVVDDYLWEHYGFGVEDLEDQLAERDELRAALADARHAYENVNGDEVEDALDRMEEILDGDD